MSRLRHYAAVYREFLATCFSQAMSFRLHFVLLIVMDLLFYASSLVTVDFIFGHVQAIGAWNREQFLFFVSFMLAVDQLHMTFVSEGFWEFSADIRTGRLDYVLLRPIGAVFCVFLRFIRPATLVNMPVPWAAMIWYGRDAGLTPLGWASLPFLVLLALTLLTSLEILMSMAMFWVVESWGLNFLRVELQRVSRWPDFVFAKGLRRVLTLVFPVLMVGSAPVGFLLDTERWSLVVGMIVATGITWLGIAFAWRAGLRSYESASS